MATEALTQSLKSQNTWPLHSVAQTQRIEQEAQAHLPPNTLMQRAGLACARMALAIAPHAHTIWIACGPGNNGGDGLEAATHLRAWGKNPVVTWLGHEDRLPADAQQALVRARQAGVTFQTHPPTSADLVMDALLGIGAQRPPEGVISEWLMAMQALACPVLCIDVPTGLRADTGEWQGPALSPTQARHTLSLLTVKPGLFTASGRDAAGQVWFNPLGITISHAPQAWLQQTRQTTSSTPAHSSHKGSMGDVVVLGGAPGMTGAAVLASLGALHGGAGRVFAGVMDEAARHSISATHPALMVRNVAELTVKNATVVCGCGGGDAIHALLPQVLSTAYQLVLDADGLNAVARDASLQTLLRNRHARQKYTVLTPHPLEAARLLNTSTTQVQQDRLQSAQQLAEQFQCVVVLKGSGSVIAAPRQTPVINASGNARLATAGTGDVLAGLIGAYMAKGLTDWEASCQATYAHGHVADTWPEQGPALDAARLAASLR
ncbi:MAG: NAD(P)H-hydrate dehydratase [Limnohabitans sp.]|nr:NAD(P)H-hydrate dehydratase [Limnohabitans sp.]